MLALATGIEAAIIIDFIETAEMIGTSVMSLLRLNNAGNSGSYNQVLEQEYELQEGQFSKQTLYNGQPINDCQLCQILNERVLKIERVCQSLWQYFPSGVFTIFSWALLGSAMRHEFIILDTQNHLCLIEMIEEKVITNGKEQKFNKLRFDVYSCDDDNSRNTQRKALMKGRLTDSVLGSITFKDGEYLYLFQINMLTNLLLLSWKKSLGKTMSFCDKISKQYARAVFYFSKMNPDIDVVLQSIFGVFTDKPYMLPRLDMILVEKVMYHGIQISEQKKQQLNGFRELIKSIRETARNPSVISLH